MADAGPALLRRAAERAADRPPFLASALLAYAHAEGLDDAGLAARLGCPDADLPALLLCRRPQGATFAADVQRIAERFGLQPFRLAEAIRVVEGVAALRAAHDAADGRPPDGLLAAARDRAAADDSSGADP